MAGDARKPEILYLTLIPTLQRTHLNTPMTSVSGARNRNSLGTLRPRSCLWGHSSVM